MNIHDDDEIYVCISHRVIAPCQHEGQHLISNWAADVEKILGLMENKNG